MEENLQRQCTGGAVKATGANVGPIVVVMAASKRGGVYTKGHCTH